MLDEESKAVQELAKTTGKAIDASQKVGGFIASLIRGPAEQAMGIWEDKLKYRRWENQIKLADRATQFLKDRGLPGPTRPVPLALALPLLEEAALADDDNLRDRWAMLLANAADANGPEVRRAYVSILAELTPFDALLLDMLFDADADPNTPRQEDGSPAELGTVDLPYKVQIVAPRNFITLNENAEKASKQTVSPDVEVSLGNLTRLGLLSSAAAFGGSANLRWVSVTALGREFVTSCRPTRTVGTTD